MKIIITCELEDDVWDFQEGSSDEMILECVSEDIPALLNGADFVVVRGDEASNAMTEGRSKESADREHYERVEALMERLATAAESQTKATVSLAETLDGIVRAAAGISKMSS